MTTQQTQKKKLDSPNWRAFWYGFSRVLGPSETVGLTEEEIAEMVDRQLGSMSSDWENIGLDFRNALQQFKEEHPELA